MNYLATLITIGVLAFSPVQNNSVGKLTLRFEGIEKVGGTVRLALYSRPSEFMVEEKAILYNFKADKKGKLEATIENLPVGSYAFAVFFDENNNKKLDKNLVGVPMEPYGFSKEPPSKWRLPNWEEVKFEVSASTISLDVSLKRWALF
ncbi:MAG: DUF2141 domain-containing protein [Saprospiraceae bacterium]|nr:DUF2141 domain-containing protein [Saprospiraceae bacterium]MCF8251601.1 DUF2141 domain-containing protein [Saprospiraceae bacterium]MCF8282063.1 DUF2141 domain-containing protein [Bacteroidales bacterium]MCF8313496.1 DUF2141 domain-containing protein [Saprospiraceae bacterium]MCF8442237.1 DUF2141 domain-containing protein [Saprospiraceae bacterium]